MNCPCCRRALHKRLLHGVTIDVCPGCAGAWLDSGELEWLLAESGGMRPARVEVELDLRGDDLPSYPYGVDEAFFRQLMEGFGRDN
jgi:Zn-finger nucleic acid-binding protein